MTVDAASDRSHAGAAGPRPASPDDARSRRLIRTLTLTVFLQWMGATAIVPMLPVYIRHLGGTDALAGVVMASFFAAGVLSQYPIGRLADRIGRRPVLIAGLVTYGVASFSFLLPINASAAIGLRAPPGRGSRRGHGGGAGHDLRVGGRRAAGAGLRLHLRGRAGRHGRRPAGREHRRRPLHVGHVPGLGAAVRR